MNGLTPRQLKVLTFIRGYIRQNGYSPTYDEIGATFGAKSRSQVHAVVHQLVDRSAITTLPGKRRAIALVEQERAAA